MQASTIKYHPSFNTKNLLKQIGVPACIFQKVAAEFNSELGEEAFIKRCIKEYRIGEGGSNFCSLPLDWKPPKQIFAEYEARGITNDVINDVSTNFIIYIRESQKIIFEPVEYFKNYLENHLKWKEQGINEWLPTLSTLMEIRERITETSILISAIAHYRMDNNLPTQSGFIEFVFSGKLDR